MNVNKVVQWEGEGGKIEVVHEGSSHAAQWRAETRKTELWAVEHVFLQIVRVCKQKGRNAPHLVPRG